MKAKALAFSSVFLIAVGCATEERPPVTYVVQPGVNSSGQPIYYQQQSGQVTSTVPGVTVTNAPGTFVLPHEAVQRTAPAPQVTPPPAEVAAPPPAQVVAAPPPQQTVVVQPPPPRVEVVPVVPGPGYVWVNGYWSWNGAWIWVPGRYTFPPRPHALWVGGGWVHERHGWRWHHGHWR
jgi:hypothetical protein